ncbi:MAG: polyphosphate polymerase domain-containing protein [Deltaproteobacteria bacterium]
MKFLLDEARARDVETRLAARLTPDPHADPALDNAYRITTIYCDTSGFEVFHRLGPHRRRKYRLRRYGSESLVFLERKTRQAERVRKRRTMVDDRDLPALSAFSTDSGWPGHWFHQQLLRRRLEPVCAVRYLRTAYVGTEDEGPLRLTFDRDLRTCLARDWALPPAACGISVLTGQVVCEFKFRGALPALFKGVIRELALEPTGVSKYREGFRAAGGGSNGSLGHA